MQWWHRAYSCAPSSGYCQHRVRIDRTWRVRDTYRFKMSDRCGRTCLAIAPLSGKRCDGPAGLVRGEDGFGPKRLPGRLDICLVVWNMFFFSPIYWEESSQLIFSYFQRGRYTTNEIYWMEVSCETDRNAEKLLTIKIHHGWRKRRSSQSWRP